MLNLNMVNKVIFLLVCLTLSSCAVETVQQQPEDPVERYAGSYSPYRYGDLTDTDVPAGYQPFYISHYSRHGSRYLIHEEDFDVVSSFEGYASQGCLSEKGMNLLSDLQRLRDEHVRMHSHLTLKGGSQQQGIAERMAKRFPQVFARGGKVRCVSSPAQRCNQSLANFALSLASEHNELDFSIYSGHRYYDIISARIKDSEKRAHYAQIRDSMVVAGGSPILAVKELFLQPEKVQADWPALTHSVYTLCCAMQCQDYQAPAMDAYFTEDQLEVLWKAENAFDYGVFCDRETFGDYRIDHVARPILNEILDQAGYAIASDDRVADLRFGHDSGLSPLLTLIGLEDYVQTDPDEAWKIWRNHEKVCMASNIQIVFYKHRSKEILVKILRNEQETLIPALKPVTGPYYSWDNLKEYLLSR